MLRVLVLSRLSNGKLCELKRLIERAFRGSAFACAGGVVSLAIGLPRCFLFSERLVDFKQGGGHPRCLALLMTSSTRPESADASVQCGIFVWRGPGT